MIGHGPVLTQLQHHPLEGFGLSMSAVKFLCEWRITKFLFIFRFNHSELLVGRKLVIFGGWNGRVSYNDMWIFDTDGLTWLKPKTAGTPPPPRHGHRSLPFCALSYAALHSDLEQYGAVIRRSDSYLRWVLRGTEGAEVLGA
jgi:hypothetical protein